jgi:hypothetical protein
MSGRNTPPKKSKSNSKISPSKKHASRADKALTAAKMKRQRQALISACQMMNDDDVTKAEVLARFTEISFSTLNTWWRTGKWRDKAEQGSRHLPDDAEAMLAAFCVENASIGNPVLKSVVKILAYELSNMIRGKYPRSEHMEGWLRGFLARNNELHIQYSAHDNTGPPKLMIKNKPQSLSSHRAQSMTRTSVQGYQDKCIGPFLKLHPELTLDHIGGYDEFMIDVNRAITSGKVVTPPGLLYTKVPGERDEHMTALSGYILHSKRMWLRQYQGLFERVAKEEKSLR